MKTTPHWVLNHPFLPFSGQKHLPSVWVIFWNTWWAERNKRTYLPSNDRGPHNQQHQLVKQRVKESNHRLQLGGVERCDAGLQFSLQVVFHDAHVSYPDWEHMLIQSVYQGKELVQILVLKSDMGLSMQMKRGKQDTYFSFLLFFSHPVWQWRQTIEALDALVAPDRFALQRRSLSQDTYF